MIQLSLESEEISKEPITVGCQEALRVKLNAVDREVAVLESHDFKGLSFVMDPGRDFETGWHGFFRDDEAMVSGCHEGIGQVSKHT